MTYDTNTALQTPVYTMVTERKGKLIPYRWHLGTDLTVAETFVFERLEAGADSVALYFDGKRVKIYDFRDLED